MATLLRNSTLVGEAERVGNNRSALRVTIEYKPGGKQLHASWFLSSFFVFIIRHHFTARSACFMAQSFGLSHIVDYLHQMGLKIAHMNTEQNTVELAFHGNAGQWRMVIGLHHAQGANKLMLIVPHMGTLSSHKRLECLEALMAVNYRIAIGKFGLDLEDDEVRLEESIPLADDAISLDQFHLAFSAIMQTASIYHSLL